MFLYIGKTQLKMQSKVKSGTKNAFISYELHQFYVYFYKIHLGKKVNWMLHHFLNPHAAYKYILSLYDMHGVYAAHVWVSETADGSAYCLFELKIDFTCIHKSSSNSFRTV